MYMACMRLCRWLLAIGPIVSVYQPNAAAYGCSLMQGCAACYSVRTKLYRS